MNTDLHQYSDTDGCMSGYQTWLYQSLVYTEQLSELTASGSDQVELGWFWTCLLYDWSLVYSQTVHVIWSNSDISRADCMCLGTQLAWTWLISGKQWQYGIHTWTDWNTKLAVISCTLFAKSTGKLAAKKASTNDCYRLGWLQCSVEAEEIIHLSHTHRPTTSPRSPTASPHFNASIHPPPTISHLSS